ncbi:MAG TPA: aldehyde dehydrogenase family protein, partial [Lacipirellulaceae bacterium]|nr:aldehyde dehydrogenase family protein [Lacipirellulaceae bacterium]
MSIATEPNLDTYCAAVAERAKQASMRMANTPTATKNKWLRQSAQLLRENHERIVDANAHDLEAAPGYGLTAAAIDRLRLNRKRIEEIAVAMEQIADLPDPIGDLIRTTDRPNGLRIEKVRVPLGVVFFIYESRPNVTADAAAICVKSGNAVILRGGKEAIHSSQAIVELLGEA